MVSHALSHKIKIYFLKNCSKSILQSQIFFHKDTLIYWQAILDTVCIHLAQERYKRWPLLNMVKTNLILYIFCATTLHLQYLIQTCFMIFIYSSHILKPRFLTIFVEFAVLLMCAVYMSMYLVTVCIYD